MNWMVGWWERNIHVEALHVPVVACFGVVWCVGMVNRQMAVYGNGGYIFTLPLPP